MGRKHSAWIGSFTLLPQSIFRRMWIFKGGHDGSDPITAHTVETGYETVREKLPYTTLDFNTKMEADMEISDKEMTCELLDENSITVGEECFRCPEAPL